MSCQSASSPAAAAPRFSLETHLARSRELLETGLASLPAYAAWRAQDPGPGWPLAERFAALPVLDKAGIRAHFPHGFVPPGRDLAGALASGELTYVQTSGTTEDRVTNFWHQASWDEAERSSWRMNAHAARLGLGGHREAILTSPYCAGVPGEGRLVPQAQRRQERFLFLNETPDPTQWTPAQCERMLAELAEFAPRTLEANPAFLAELARYAADQGRPVFQPELIVLTFEYSSQLYLRQIRRAFTGPMCSSYGSTETGYVFMECEAGRLHQNLECAWVDFQPFRPEHGGPRLGRLLITPLANPWCIFLRFDVGDLASLADGPCPCGRHQGLTLAALEGRMRNLTFRADSGAAVTQHAVDLALAAVPGLRQYRVEQSAPDAYRLYLAAAPGAAPARLAAAAQAALREVYGAPARIATELHSALSPQVPPGKYRLVKPTYSVDFEAVLAPWRPSGQAR